MPLSCSHLRSGLLQQHAGLPKEAISTVACIGPIRASGRRLVLVKFRTVREKHAALKASSGLRQLRIRMDDDLTKAQLANRQAQQPAHQRYRDEGHKTWWRQDVLLYSSEGSSHRHRHTAQPSAPRPPAQRPSHGFPSRPVSGTGGRPSTSSPSPNPRAGPAAATSHNSGCPNAPAVLPGPPRHPPTTHPSPRRAAQPRSGNVAASARRAGGIA